MMNGKPEYVVFDRVVAKGDAMKAKTAEAHRLHALMRIAEAETKLAYAEKEIADWGMLVPDWLYAPRFLSVRQALAKHGKELAGLIRFIAQIPSNFAVEDPPCDEPQWPGRGD